VIRFISEETINKIQPLLKNLYSSSSLDRIPKNDFGFRRKKCKSFL